MRTRLLFLSIITAFSISYSQNAADYFPAAAGFTWWYNAVPLDSLNNPMDSLAFAEADSFASVNNYLGKDAEIVLSKTGPAELLPLVPYTDTSYYHMEGANGWEYFNMTGIDSLFPGLDSSLVITLLQILGSFRDWYSVYRFANPVNSTYQIFNHDTTINYNGTSIALRFRAEGKRLTDENLSTPLGDFNCKKFIQDNKLFYLFLGIIPVQILDQADSIWIAPSHWIVKRLAPAMNVDLSFAGLPAFYVPGIKYDIGFPPPPTGINDQEGSPLSYRLYQNYPNPFNPSTVVRYSIGESNITSIKVYDILGNEVAVLFNKEQGPGTYEVVFDASDLAGGIYYCRLISGAYVSVRKMVLLK